MKPRDEQIVSLAKSLLQQTISSRITWQRTERSGRYLYVGQTASVMLQGPLTVLSRALVGSYSLTLVDNGGNTIDSVEVNANWNPTVSAALAGDVSKSELIQAIHPILQQLFDEVERYMANPNPAIDDLIREIETK